MGRKSNKKDGRGVNNSGRKMQALWFQKKIGEWKVLGVQTEVEKEPK